MHKWIRPVVALVILSVSMLLLSAIFDTLNPYLAMPSAPEKGPLRRRVYLTEDRRLSPPSQIAVKPGRLIFVVSPANPVLFWRTSTADYYDGVGWYRTTSQITTHKFPSIQRGNATQVFTVELNMTEKEVMLPVPPPQNDLTQPVLFPSISHEYHFDEIGDTYGIRNLDVNQETTIVYQAGWYYTEIDKWRISLDNIPQEIREIYLQLPTLPIEVKELAEMLRRPEMNPIDQILSDVAYFLIHFEYDLDYWLGRTRRTITQDWVLSYLQWRKGVCLDAATALAVILRCQGIPSRITLGYKPTKIVGDKIYYYSNTSHAETEAYLPPYGWVRFDATPFSPLDLPEDFGILKPEECLTMEISPPEAEGYPGESVFYHLVINNSRETKDHFKLAMHSTSRWNLEVTPESLPTGPFETCDALIEVKIPENASYGQVNVITVTATSTYDPTVKVSNTTIVRVSGVKRVSTLTDITYINNSVFRGDNFYVEGTVFTTDHEPVHDMPILILLKENKEAKEGIVCGNGSSQHGFFFIEGQVPFDIELGDYAVVAISLGTTVYAPSSSDPTIRVAARTYLELDIRLEGTRVTRQFLVKDHVIISGFLRLDNGTTLLGATLELEVLPPESPSVRKHKIITDQGFFIKKFTFWTPGTYELNATFLGKGYIAGSYSHRKIEVESPVVQSLTEDHCVRGEVLHISGNVSSNSGGIRGEPVTITFDGEVLETVKTGLNGTFFHNWEISSQIQPGWHLLEYILPQRRGIGVTHPVRVIIKPQIEINTPEKVTSGEHFTCTISLRDDLGFPIEGEEIFIGNYGLSSKTDEHGNVEFMLYTLPLWWGEMNLLVAFEGTEEYLPSTTSFMITVQTSFASILFVLMPSALFILGLTMYSGKFGRFFHKEESDKAEVERTYPLKKEVSQTKLKKIRALRINFPDIRAPFPNVWGIKDTLRIECAVDGSPLTSQKENEVELLVDGKRTSKDQLSKNRHATFSHVFHEKGEHEVGAKLVRRTQQRSVRADTKLRIVDYREEIIRLYKRFLQHLAHQNVDWKDTMTAREVERLLLNTGDFDSRSLHRVIECFERAEYSDHEVDRENYETMYLSLKELITDVD